MCLEMSCKDRIAEQWKHPLSRIKGTLGIHNIAMWLNKNYQYDSQLVVVSFVIAYL